MNKCRDCELPVSGKKADLIQRLIEHQSTRPGTNGVSSTHCQSELEETNKQLQQELTKTKDELKKLKDLIRSLYSSAFPSCAPMVLCAQCGATLPVTATICDQCELLQDYIQEAASSWKLWQFWGTTILLNDMLRQKRTRCHIVPQRWPTFLQDYISFKQSYKLIWSV